MSRYPDFAEQAREAKAIGVNARDLRTLEVDPARAEQLRGEIPADRLGVAESGIRDPDSLGRLRALEFDAALVGEALMRAPDPAVAVATFVAAGRMPADPSEAARAPMVKICGITDAAGALAALEAGADAVGLNLVAGTPRALDVTEAAELASLVRSAARAATQPRVVAVTADSCLLKPTSHNHNHRCLFLNSA